VKSPARLREPWRGGRIFYSRPSSRCPTNLRDCFVARFGRHLPSSRLRDAATTE